MSDPAWTAGLPAFLAEAWRRLEAREGAARTPVLGTLGTAGPELRTVVLRHADARSATLEVHTDAAAPKVTDLRRAPAAALLVWDPAAALQMRLGAHIEVLAGHDAAAAWAAVPAAARAHYGGAVPGTPLATADAPESDPDPARFAVLRARVHALDLLHLGAVHRRARYVAADGFRGAWIAP